MMEGLFYYPFLFAHTFKNEDSSDPDLLWRQSDSVSISV